MAEGSNKFTYNMPIFLIKKRCNPYGPGDLNGLKENMAELISLSSSGLSRADRSMLLKLVMLGLILDQFVKLWLVVYTVLKWS